LSPSSTSNSSRHYYSTSDNSNDINNNSSSFEEDNEEEDDYEEEELVQDNINKDPYRVSTNNRFIAGNSRFQHGKDNVRSHSSSDSEESLPRNEYEESVRREQNRAVQRELFNVDRGFYFSVDIAIVLSRGC